MLVITRRIGETLIAGEATNSDDEQDIRFTILGVKGNQVRIGILAPKQIALEREELRRRPGYVRRGGS